MKTRLALVAVVFLLTGPGLRGTGFAQDRGHVGPEHPRDLVYPKATFTPPSPATHRLILSNGLAVYAVPDRTLPSVRVRVVALAGTAFDPVEKTGATTLAFRALATCGAGKLGPAELSARLDALSMTLDGHADERAGLLDAWLPAESLEPGLDLVTSVLREPAFDEARLKKVRAELAAELNADDEDAHKVALHRAREAVFEDHPLGLRATAATVEALDRASVVAAATDALVPARVVLAVSGDFDRQALVKLLEARLGDWNARGAKPRKLAPVAEPAKPPLVLIDRPVDQATILMARVGPRPDDKDVPGLLIADHLLGSGSFTSRVVQRVRSDEGLSYNVGSTVEESLLGPGLVKIDLGTRARDASFALSLVFDETRRFAKEGPTQEELAAAKEAFLGAYPQRFATPFSTACELAENHLAGLGDDYLAELPKRIAALDVEAVRRAAARFFDPSRMQTVIVGQESLARRDAARGLKLDDLATVEVEK